MRVKNSFQDKAILLGLRQARAITKKYAKSFYFASHFLGVEKKQAAYSVYSICRISDETVDKKDILSAKDRLVQIKQKIESIYAGSNLNENLLLAFKSTIVKYHIPRQYFQHLLEGMEMDLQKKRYPTFTELYNYCYKAAGVVGLIMLKIFGCNNHQAEQQAVDLGVAMQLTNILRDIKEDFQRGRIYLPQEDMERFSVRENDIASGCVNENFIKLLQYQIERARGYYRESAKGIKLLSDLSARLTVLAMKEIYSGILQAIEENGYNVYQRWAQVSTAKKALIVSKILFSGQWR